MKVLIKSKKELRNFSKAILKKIEKKRGAVIVGLVGDLGVGKTAFVQETLKILGVKENITSPTFTLIKPYKLRKSRFSDVYHIDCYRLANPKELLTLGLEDLFDNPKNIIFIEWADKLKKDLPNSTLWLNFSHGEKESERLIDLVE